MAKARGTRQRAPVWAVLCTVLGAVLMIGSGGALVASEWLEARYAPQEGDLFGELDDGEDPGADIEGPLNILLVGLDTRPSRPDEDPRADAIMVVHVNEALDSGYFISFPRDALVTIPPFEKTGYLGQQQARLNSAFFEGARKLPGEEHPNLERGFELMAATMSQLIGIPPTDFDAGAVVQFQGFEGIVDALDGITVELDEVIESRHREPDGSHRELAPSGNGFVGPQMVYQPGQPPCGPAEEESGPFSCQLEGWQALDVVRQRYGIEDGDYGRQDNQQKILKAIIDQAFSRDIVTNPVALDRVLRAGGDAVVFDGRGRQPVDFAFALRDLRSGSIVSVGLPGGGVGTGDNYQGEQLDPVAYELFTALQNGELDAFIAANSELAS